MVNQLVVVKLIANYLDDQLISFSDFFFFFSSSYSRFSDVLFVLVKKRNFHLWETFTNIFHHFQDLFGPNN